MRTGQNVPTLLVANYSECILHTASIFSLYSHFDHQVSVYMSTSHTHWFQLRSAFKVWLNYSDINGDNFDSLITLNINQPAPSFLYTAPQPHVVYGVNLLELWPCDMYPLCPLNPQETHPTASKWWIDLHIFTVKQKHLLIFYVIGWPECCFDAGWRSLKVDELATDM